MKKLPFFILILSGILSSCSKENRGDCFKGTGDPATETRTLTAFTKIYVRDNVDVYLIQDTLHSIRVEAGKNLLGLIRSEVVNGELILSNDNRCNWARSYKKGVIKVYITFPVLTNIRHYGSGMIKSTDTIACNTLTILTHESGDVDMKVKASTTIYTQLHGSADVTLEGTTPNHGNYHVGTGYLYCEKLVTHTAWTYSEASGNEYFNATNNLKVTIEWVGDTYYKGSPSLTALGTGTGKIIPMN